MPLGYQCKSNTFIVKMCSFFEILRLNKTKLFILQQFKNIPAGRIKSCRIGI